MRQNRDSTPDAFACGGPASMPSTEDPSPAPLARASSHDHDLAARAQPAYVLGRVLAIAWRRARAMALRGHRAYRRMRAARATVAELQQLDDRLLRDMGFTRAEIGSVAAELSGEAERSRQLLR